MQLLPDLLAPPPTSSTPSPSSNAKTSPPTATTAPIAPTSESTTPSPKPPAPVDNTLLASIYLPLTRASPIRLVEHRTIQTTKKIQPKSKRKQVHEDTWTDQPRWVWTSRES